jgi:DNA-binding YbaB/EbfC family protein
MTFDMNALMRQAQEAMEQMQRLQEEAANEIVTGSAGGGAVIVTATAGGDVKEIRISPQALADGDAELLGDLVAAAVNQALTEGKSLIQSKVGQALPPGLGGLLPGM